MSKNTNLSFLTDYITADITNGRIGINNASPTVAFDVSGVTKFSSDVTTGGKILISDGGSGLIPCLKIGSATTGISQNVSEQLNFITSGTTKMVITSTGNVGIGTSSPNYTLHIDSNTTLTRFQITNSTTGQGGGVGLQIIQNGLDASITNRSNGYLGFETVGTERMRITSAGNVGIGTSAPRATLDVSDGTVNTSGEAIYQGLFTGPSRPSTSDLTAILTIQSNDAMAINKGGSIAFGGRAVASNSAGANWAGISGLKENATGSDYSGYLQFWTRGGSSSEKMRITSGGDLIVGRTDAGAGNIGGKISSTGFIEAVVNNDACFSANRKNATGVLMIFQYQNSTKGTISTDGTNTAYNTSSDYRLKEDFKIINGLEKVSKINVYDFKWKDTNLRMDGVLAHELQEVLPYAVYGEKDGEDMQGVDYSKLVPVLIKAIQELSAENTSLKNRIEVLENK